jgi:hypothetical protein
MKSDHIKRMITFTGDNIKRLSLYLVSFVGPTDVTSFTFTFDDVTLDEGGGLRDVWSFNDLPS